MFSINIYIYIYIYIHAIWMQRAFGGSPAKCKQIDTVEATLVWGGKSFVNWCRDTIGQAIIYILIGEDRTRIGVDKTRQCVDKKDRAQINNIGKLIEKIGALIEQDRCKIGALKCTNRIQERFKCYIWGALSALIEQDRCKIGALRGTKGH